MIMEKGEIRLIYSISFDSKLVRLVKKTMKIFVIFLAVVMVLFLAVMFISKGINYNKHKVTGENSADTGMYVTLGGMEQYIHIRSDDVSNPVIIYLHGGPGSSDSFVTYMFTDSIEEKYTFVSWDQRGAGRTYEHNKSIDGNNDTVSFDRALADLDELVDMMRERYGQDKVVIMGHSYGTYLGARYVYDHPDKVSHYIGVGQMVNSPDDEQRSYEDALTLARAAGDDTAKMEKAWSEYQADTEDLQKMMAVRSFTGKYHKAPKEANTIWMGISSPYMGLADLRYFFRQMDIDKFIDMQKGLMSSLNDDMNEYCDYQVPVDIIMGEYDWTCPTVCAREYYDRINAPSKGFYVIEGCGHTPQYDDPAAFAETVLDILG